MPDKKYKDTYVSDFYNVNETIEILKKCPADIYFKLYHKIRKELDSSMGKPKKDTLSKRVDQMETTLKQIVEMIKRLDDRVDTGFKQVNTRLDNLEVRVDRIEQRLDYNELQIENINKRLDYNELKPLPDRK